jgi:hypothetical protein
MLGLIAWIVAAVLPESSVNAAELIMYRRAGCPWCQAWDRDVGPIYGKTDIGRRIPLRRVDLDSERPQIVLRSPIIYTPTFVLAVQNREIGRIEGYPGESFFWELLERLAQRLQSRQPNGLSTAVSTAVRKQLVGTI